VPPFSLDRLEDLITAVAGWVEFQVERVKPGLGPEAGTAYRTCRAEGVDALARQHAEQFNRPYGEVIAEFRQLDQHGRLQRPVPIAEKRGQETIANRRLADRVCRHMPPH
jgi:hypothetical protein